MTKAKNHYTPKSYLKAWCDQDAKLYAHKLLVPSTNSPEWVHLYPSQIGYQEHLYTEVIGNNEFDSVEQWLDSHFESPAAPVIQKVIGEKRLVPDDWKKLINFVAAQDVRTPKRFKEHFERVPKDARANADDTVSRVLKEHKERKDLGLPHPYVESLSREDQAMMPFKVSIENQQGNDAQVNVEFLAGRRSWVFSIRHVLTKTMRILYTHKWSILKAPPGISWPTSDNPVVRLAYTDKDNYNLKGGWGVKNCEIILPLSPRHILYTIVGGKSFPRYQVLDNLTAIKLKKMIVENADKLIISEKPDDWITKHHQRLVDPELYQKERQAWSDWHKMNSEAEREFNDDAATT